MKNTKKGFAHWVEVLLSTILILIIFLGFFESDSEIVFKYKSNSDLQQVGWKSLDNLDEYGLLNTSNFSKIDLYLDKGFGSNINYDLEYYNSSGCHAVDSGLIGPPQQFCNGTGRPETKNDIASAIYTTTKGSNPESIRIYLWRRL